MRALIAWNLRRIRVAQGLSQERLAHDARMDRAYVGAIERQTMNPTADVLERLSDALAVHVSELFMEPEPGATEPPNLRKGRRRLRDAGL